jgi:hypothetical protein
MTIELFIGMLDIKTNEKAGQIARPSCYHPE